MTDNFENIKNRKNNRRYQKHNVTKPIRCDVMYIKVRKAENVNVAGIVAINVR